MADPPPTPPNKRKFSTPKNLEWYVSAFSNYHVSDLYHQQSKQHDKESGINGHRLYEVNYTSEATLPSTTRSEEETQHQDGEPDEAPEPGRHRRRCGREEHAGDEVREAPGVGGRPENEEHSDGLGEMPLLPQEGMEAGLVRREQLLRCHGEGLAHSLQLQGQAQDCSSWAATSPRRTSVRSISAWTRSRRLWARSTSSRRRGRPLITISSSGFSIRAGLGLARGVARVFDWKGESG